MTKCSAENLSISVGVNNRISTAGYVYDAAGNLTTNATDGVTATYDAESRIGTAAKSAVTTTYVYDSDGNRVKKTNGSTGTLYWYMTPGIVAESDLNGAIQHEYVFFHGRRVARRDPVNTVYYFFSDRFNTASILTDSAGNVTHESDYYPWGGELVIMNAIDDTHKFTDKERDTETGLDYFGARYYSNLASRFTSADPLSPLRFRPEILTHFLLEPQNWNKYAYGVNSPLRFKDLGGYFPGPDHEKMMVTAMQSRGYSEKAQQVAANADRKMDSLYNAASGVAGFHHLVGTKENPQHGERMDHQSKEDAQKAAKNFVDSKVKEAVQYTLKGAYEDALKALGEAGHTQQDIVRHKFERASEHPLSEAKATDAETKAAVQATQEVLDQFESAYNKAANITFQGDEWLRDQNLYNIKKYPERKNPDE